MSLSSPHTISFNGLSSVMNGSHATTRQGIEEECRLKFCGTASIRVSCLQPGPSPHIRGTKARSHHVQSLRRLLREKDSAGYSHKVVIRVTVRLEDLEDAVARTSISRESLAAVTVPLPKLEFSPDVKLECIKGQDCLLAMGNKKRCAVDLFLDDLSIHSKQALADNFHYEEKLSDGEAYCSIRQHQGVFGEENSYLEHVWLARLAAMGSNKEKLFHQLSRHRKFAAAFDALLAIPALFVGFRLGSIHQLLGMKCDEPNLTYLKHIQKWWHSVCDGRTDVMQALDEQTIETLQGTSPGSCLKDREQLSTQLRAGRIFSRISTDVRDWLWERVCGASRRCLVPSLFTFFEDRKFLVNAATWIRHVVDVGPKETIDRRLEECFTDANQQSSKCTIQVSASTYKTLPGTIGDRLNFGMRLLWLEAFRYDRCMTANAKKRGGRLASLAELPSEASLFILASIASRLGFETDLISRRIAQPTDRRIAENALYAAREQGSFQYPDFEACVQGVLRAFATAQPSLGLDVEAAEEEGRFSDLGETHSEIREAVRPLRRYGLPLEVDHDLDKMNLYLPNLQRALDNSQPEMTSTFVRWSVYCSYFGRPPSMEHLSAETITTTIESLSDVSHRTVTMESNMIVDNSSEDGSTIPAVSDCESQTATGIPCIPSNGCSGDSEVEHVQRAWERVREETWLLEQSKRDLAVELESLQNLKTLVERKTQKLHRAKKTSLLRQQRAEAKERNKSPTRSASGPLACLI